MMQLKGTIAAFAAAIMLGGCAFGLAGGPPATYDLQAPPVEKVRGGNALQLTIYPPVAVKTIDTEEILVKSANGRVAYFSGAAWGDRLPRLFQARLVEALANSGAFRAILTKSGTGSRATCRSPLKSVILKWNRPLSEPRPS